MSDYANKLSSLAEKKQKLLEEENKLIEKRKQEIGKLAEKYNLLTISDEIITGLFSEAHIAIKNKTDKVTHWESEGAKLLKRKANSTEA